MRSRRRRADLRLRISVVIQDMRAVREDLLGLAGNPTVLYAHRQAYSGSGES